MSSNLYISLPLPQPHPNPLHGEREKSIWEPLAPISTNFPHPSAAFSPSGDGGSPSRIVAAGGLDCWIGTFSYSHIGAFSFLDNDPIRDLVVCHHPQHVVAGEEPRTVKRDGIGSRLVHPCGDQADGEPVDGIHPEGYVGLHRHLVGDGQVGDHRVGVELTAKQAGDGDARGLAVGAVSSLRVFVGRIPEFVLDGLVGGVVGQVVVVLRGIEERRPEMDRAVGGVVAADGLEDGVAVAPGVPAAGFQHTLRVPAEGVGAVVGDALAGAHPQHLRERVARGQHHPSAGVGPGGDDPFRGDGIRMGIQSPGPVGVGGDGPVIQREDGLDVGLDVIQLVERVLVAEQQQGVALEAEEILRAVLGGHHQFSRGERGLRVGFRAQHVEAVAEQLRVGIGEGVVLVDGLQPAEIPEDVGACRAGVLVFHLILDQFVARADAVVGKAQLGVARVELRQQQECGEREVFHF
jgi:hypothetical protein